MRSAGFSSMPYPIGFLSNFEQTTANMPRGESAEIIIAPRSGIELIYEWEKKEN